jgi:hypothetical protein
MLFEQTFSELRLRRALKRLQPPLRSVPYFSLLLTNLANDEDLKKKSSTKIYETQFF